MVSRKSALAVFCVLAACGGQVPDSKPYARGGVGFGSYDEYPSEREQRDLALETRRVNSLPSPVPEERAIAAQTLGVLNATRPAEAQPAPAPAPVETASVASDAAPAASAPNNPSISDEQSFAAVSSRETIESDKERLARQRESYQVIQPEAVPDRPNGDGPNIVAYALSTTNRVGEQLYRRSGDVSETRYQRACARYTTSDKAQEAFLQAGGPKRDSKGLDPDGDGFACYWDPAPFRAARGG